MHCTGDDELRMDGRLRDFLAVVGYVYLQHGNASHAASLLEAVHELYPHDKDVVRLLAYVYLRLGRFQDCLHLTDYLLGGNSQDVPALVWLLRSRALYGQGRHREAHRLWEQARKSNT